MADDQAPATPPGVVLAFPKQRTRIDLLKKNEQSCLDCRHIHLGETLICGEYMEVIVYDDVAKECPEFEPFRSRNANGDEV